MISILRLSHRIFRDKRISTHCALVGRALGAKEFFYTGEKDKNLEDSIKRVSRQWGGPFQIKHLKNEKDFLKKFPGKVIHLTAYGTPFQKKIKDTRKHKNILLVVGGEKVPPEIYKTADYNLSVSSQPHSEAAALGIFLYELQKRKFPKNFKNPHLKIIPQERGKLVKKLD